MSAGRKMNFALKQFTIFGILIAVIMLASACGYAAEAVTAGMTDKMVPEAEPPEAELPEETVAEMEPAAEEITFTAEFIRSEDVMPYALFTPSSAENGEAVPLIVWLHGMSERDAEEDWYMGIGLPQVLRDWRLEGFHAYVICPQLYGDWNDGTWCSQSSAMALRQLLDNFIAEHNVDKEHIIIGGFSLGGRGAMYMALELPEYFSKLVVFSSLSLSERDITEIEIPALGCSEYAVSWNAFMKTEFPSVFGENSVWFYDATHTELIDRVFNDDKDGNRRADIVEWMLGPDAVEDGAAVRD